MNADIFSRENTTPACNKTGRRWSPGLHCLDEGTPATLLISNRWRRLSHEQDDSCTLPWWSSCPDEIPGFSGDEGRVMQVHGQYSVSILFFGPALFAQPGRWGERWGERWERVLHASISLCFHHDDSLFGCDDQVFTLHAVAVRRSLSAWQNEHIPSQAVDL
ncbi:hypothetical protein BKA93DRAFT_65674 [Sparassis latifolia]